MREELANLFDFRLTAGRTVVRVVQKNLDFVQNDPEAGAMRRRSAMGAGGRDVGVERGCGAVESRMNGRADEAGRREKEPEGEDGGEGAAPVGARSHQRTTASLVSPGNRPARQSGRASWDSLAWKAMGMRCLGEVACRSAVDGRFRAMHERNWW